MEPKNVIERVREQLQREGKERGKVTATYITLPDGRQARGNDGVHLVMMKSPEALELVALAHGNGKADEKVKALERGHKFAMLPGCKQQGANLVDDIYHLLDAASSSAAPSKAK